MPSATASLPSDPEALRALAISLQASLAARDAELHAKTLHIEKLRATSRPCTPGPRMGPPIGACAGISVVEPEVSLAVGRPRWRWGVRRRSSA